MAYGLIRRGMGVRFLGREIGKGLINLIRQMDAASIEALEFNLEAWEAREVEKATRKRNDAALAAITDKVACIGVFIDNLPETSRTVSALVAAIDFLFEEKTGQLLALCTVHKSKGMEWDHVFILDRHLMPSKYATQEWMKVQESNIVYVAITRAKTHLSYINSECWKE